jgi:hypothetical protein
MQKSLLVDEITRFNVKQKNPVLGSIIRLLLFFKLKRSFGIGIREKNSTSQKLFFVLYHGMLPSDIREITGFYLTRCYPDIVRMPIIDYDRVKQLRHRDDHKANKFSLSSVIGQIFIPTPWKVTNQSLDAINTENQGIIITSP